MLVLRSPLEDQLSANRVKRRVRAFVMLAIIAFLAAGIAANSLWTSANAPTPPTAPVQDTVGTQEQGDTLAPTADPTQGHAAHRASGHP